jgi:NADPH2:quinone reductase
VNPVDYKIRKGLVGGPHAYPLILGYDVSGIVEALGDGVTELKPGDAVYYFAPINIPGAYAEYHAIHHRLVAPKPKNLSHAEAASVPLVGLTVWESLFDRAGIRIGESILVHAGAGGTGSMAIQLARWTGATVFTTVRSQNEAFVRSLGADYVIDYQQTDFVEAIKSLTHDRGVDVVFDTVGGEVLARSFEAVSRYGRVVSIVETEEPISLLPLFMRNASFHYEFMALSLNFDEGIDQKRTILLHLGRLLEKHVICPVVQRTFPLAEAGEAHQWLENRQAQGKVVLSIAEEEGH